MGNIFAAFILTSAKAQMVLFCVLLGVALSSILVFYFLPKPERPSREVPPSYGTLALSPKGVSNLEGSVSTEAASEENANPAAGERLAVSSEAKSRTRTKDCVRRSRR